MRKATKSTKLWIARDSNGDLYLYDSKPIKTDNSWLPIINRMFSPNIMRLNSDLFPDVKWEDDEPKVVTVKL